MEKSNIGPQGNVYLEDYQTVDANTGLLPFRKTPGNFITFNDCRNTTVLGYAYPETQRWNFKSDEAYQADVTATIATMYGGRARAQTQVKVTSTNPTAFGQTLQESNGTYTDWNIDTQAIVSKLPPTFIVKFSLAGTFNTDSMIDLGSWMMLMPERINDVHTQKDPTAPEKTMNGTTSITARLVDQISEGKLASLDPVDVVPLLTEHLTWNVYNVSSLSSCLAPTLTSMLRNAVSASSSQMKRPFQ
jgi:tyrosinase